MDGGELGPVGWHTVEGNLVCSRCGAIEVDTAVFAREMHDGYTCIRCNSVWDKGAWWGKPGLQLMWESMQKGDGDMWDDREKKLVQVDAETAAQADQQIVFRVGETVEVKGLRFLVDQVRGNRLTLKPVGRRLR